MSNVIRFLEIQGGKSTSSAAEYAATVALLDIDEEQRQALLDRDCTALSQLLDGRPRMLFFVNTPSPDDHEIFPDDDKDDDGVPDEEVPPYEPK